MKHRAPGLLTAALGLSAAVLLGGALSGCIIVGDHGGPGDSGWNSNPPPELPAPMLVSIDTDQTMEATPGDGVGIFVEYSSGGNWLIWTTCDINVSSVVCNFDVFASVDAASSLMGVEAVDTEGYDSVELLPNGEAHLHAETASDVDAMLITTTPGAILRVEASLDGAGSERFVYWVSDGVVHTGAPTNPVDFQPTKP